MNRATTSASNIARRELCPGSAAAEEGLPEEDSEDAEEGTLLHKIDAGELKEKDQDLTGEQRDILKYARSADEDIFRAVKSSLEIPDGEPFDEGRETEMWFYRGIKKLFPGHVDRWRYYPGFKALIIIDKKYGRKEVTPAEANMQLRAYAVMGAKRWTPDKSLVAINQPRLKYEDRLSMAEYTKEEIPAARDHILRVWDAAHAPNAPRIAGFEQCRYCKAKLICDAYHARYGFLVAQAEDGIAAFTGQLSKLDDIALDKVKQAVVFAKLIEVATNSEIMARKEVGGMPMYDIHRTGSVSTITDPLQAVALLRELGFSDNEIIARARFSLDKLSDDLRERDELTMKAAKMKIRDKLMPVLDIVPKSPSLQRIKGWKPELTNGNQ